LKGDKETLKGLVKQENIGWNIHGLFALYYESNEKIRGYDELQFLRFPRNMQTSRTQLSVKKVKVEPKSSKKQKTDSIVSFKVEKKTNKLAASSPSSSSVRGGKNVTDATLRNLGDLQKILDGCDRSPSEKLTDALKELNKSMDPEATPLETRVDQFVRVCVARFRERHSADDDLARVESTEDLAVTLYYKMLEAVVTDEKKRLTALQLAAVVSQDVLHHALLAACFEVVQQFLASVFYNTSQSTFEFLQDLQQHLRLNLQPRRICLIV
jgi:hypothetical protein